MKPKRTFFGALFLFLAATTYGQGQAPQPPATETVAPNIPGVIAGGTRVQVIKEGFRGTEGPIALPDGTLIFTETAESRITRIDKNGNTSTFLENTNETNGLAFDSKGRLIGVQRAPGKQGIAVLHPKGSEAVLASNIDGKPFDRPNDLTVDKKGGVYFTDPNPGLVYYVTPGGKTIKVAEGITRPNGILLDRDEKILFVNDSGGEYLLAFDVQADGTVHNRRNFAKYEGVQRTEEGINSSADGLAIDSEGASTLVYRLESRSSARKASTWAPFRFRSGSRTLPSPAPIRKRSTWSAAAQPSRCKCSPRDSWAARNSRFVTTARGCGRPSERALTAALRERWKAGRRR